MIKVHKDVMKSLFICADIMPYTYIFNSDFVSAHIGSSFQIEAYSSTDYMFTIGYL